MKKKENLGNPLVVSSALEASKTESGQNVVSDISTTLKVAFLVAGGIFLARYGYKQYKKVRSRKYAQKNASSPEVQAAIMLHNAMFSGTLELLGFEFTIPDGTDEETLNKLALKISLDDVSRAYKILFDRTLILDIQNELDSKELQSFFQRIKSKGVDTKTPSKSLIPFLVGEPLYCINKGGIVLKKAYLKNPVKVTNETAGYYKYGEKIGTVEKVLRNENSEIYYVIDRRFILDSISGYGYTNHRNVTNKNPNKI